MFEDLFGFGFNGGAGGGRGRQGPQRTEDVNFDLPITLEEFFKGKKKKLKISRKVLCKGCKGRGTQKEGVQTKCDGCNGQGIKIVVHRLGPGMIQQMQTTCPDCNGTGQKIREQDKCKECKGNKTTPEQQILEVDVFPGMAPDTKITFYGYANEQPGMETGDVIVKLSSAKEDEEDNFANPSIPQSVNDVKRPKFQRLNNSSDLMVELKVSLVEALLGFNLSFKHLDDRVVIVKSPQHHVISTDGILTVEGEGMPMPKSSGRGDLYIKMNIVMPSNDFMKGLGAPKEKMLRSLLPEPFHGVPVDVQVDGEQVVEHVAQQYNAEQYKAKQRAQANAAREQARQSKQSEAYHDDDGEEGGDGRPSCRPM